LGSFRRRFALAAEQAHSFAMTIFKCPHCGTGYELIMTHISFRQRSYANCQVCWKAMYSWDSSRVPRFTLLEKTESTPTRM
jgi:transcription elongation factor Elf1